jgi:hypothetical protein
VEPPEASSTELDPARRGTPLFVVLALLLLAATLGGAWYLAHRSRAPRTPAPPPATQPLR